jgi:hypothetical protein
MAGPAAAAAGQRQAPNGLIETYLFAAKKRESAEVVAIICVFKTPTVAFICLIKTPPNNCGVKQYARPSTLAK